MNLQRQKGDASQLHSSSDKSGTMLNVWGQLCWGSAIGSITHVDWGTNEYKGLYVVGLMYPGLLASNHTTPFLRCSKWRNRKTPRLSGNPQERALVIGRFHYRTHLVNLSFQVLSPESNWLYFICTWYFMYLYISYTLRIVFIKCFSKNYFGKTFLVL